jgi:hypothetical protein
MVNERNLGQAKKVFQEKFHNELAGSLGKVIV